jgi:Siphovirus Gp157
LIARATANQRPARLAIPVKEAAMPLPANLYAVPDVAPPQRKLSLAAKRERAKAGQEKELRLKRKCDQADRVLSKIETRCASLAQQIKILHKRKAFLEARAAKIEDRCLEEMSAAGLEKICGMRIALIARPAPAALVVDDESLIPIGYIREKLVSSVDKVAIKSDLAKGVEVAGVHLEQKVSLLRK